MPEIRTDDFSGRNQIMLDLKSAFIKRHIVALVGLGGIGKTQSALEFIQRNESEYQSIFWIDATSEASIQNSYEQIGRLLAPSMQDATINELATFANDWLKSNTKWLLVFDNADDLSLLKPYLAGDVKGHMLITSRQQIFEDTKRHVERIPVLGMSRDEAITFLLNRTQSEDNIENRQYAFEIAQELDYLPLALEQAGAYITQTNCLLEEYLVQYRALQLDMKIDLLEKGSPDEEKYARTVRTTWEMNFRAIEKDHPPTAELLYFSTILNRDSIELAVLLDMYSYLGNASRAFMYQEGLTNISIRLLAKPLLAYSLVTFDAGKHFYTIHRLVQLVIRQRMGVDLCKEYIKRVSAALYFILPSDYEAMPWAKLAQMQLHVLDCADHAIEYSVVNMEISICLNNVAAYLRRNGSYKLAIALVSGKIWRLIGL